MVRYLCFAGSFLAGTHLLLIEEADDESPASVDSEGVMLLPHVTPGSALFALAQLLNLYHAFEEAKQLTSDPGRYLASLHASMADVARIAVTMALAPLLAAATAAIAAPLASFGAGIHAASRTLDCSVV